MHSNARRKHGGENSTTKRVSRVLTDTEIIDMECIIDRSRGCEKKKFKIKKYSISKEKSEIFSIAVRVNAHTHTRTHNKQKIIIKIATAVGRGEMSL